MPNGITNDEKKTKKKKKRQQPEWMTPMWLSPTKWNRKYYNIHNKKKKSHRSSGRNGSTAPICLESSFQCSSVRRHQHISNINITNLNWNSTVWVFGEWICYRKSVSMWFRTFKIYPILYSTGLEAAMRAGTIVHNYFRFYTNIEYCLMFYWIPLN